MLRGAQWILDGSALDHDSLRIGRETQCVVELENRIWLPLHASISYIIITTFAWKDLERISRRRMKPKLHLAKRQNKHLKKIDLKVTVWSGFSCVKARSHGVEQRFSCGRGLAVRSICRTGKGLDAKPSYS